jgi:hypothetical protein
MWQRNRRQLLAQEYLGLRQRIEDASTRRWHAAAILVGGAFAAAGLIISKQNHGGNAFWQALILGGPIIVVLFTFYHWYQRRFKHQIEVLHTRFRELEEQLGFHTDRGI